MSILNKKTEKEQQLATSGYMPDGDHLVANKVEGTVAYKYLNALSKTFKRAEDAINTVHGGMDLFNSTNNIDDYEQQMVGIPDAIFTSNNFVVEIRQGHVLVKLAADDVEVTNADLVWLCSILGLDIIAYPGYYFWLNPDDIVSFSTVKEARFSIVIEINPLTSEPRTGGFPVVFPWVFGGTRTHMAMNFIESIIDSNVQLKWYTIPFIVWYDAQDPDSYNLDIPGYIDIQNKASSGSGTGECLLIPLGINDHPSMDFDFTTTTDFLKTSGMPVPKTSFSLIVVIQNEFRAAAGDRESGVCSFYSTLTDRGDDNPDIVLFYNVIYTVGDDDETARLTFECGVTGIYTDTVEVELRGGNYDPSILQIDVNGDTGQVSFFEIGSNITNEDTVNVPDLNAYEPVATIVKGQGFIGCVSDGTLNGTESGQKDLFNGYIGEIIMYNKVISTQTREAVTDFLIEKWSFSQSLIIQDVTDGIDTIQDAIVAVDTIQDITQ